MLDMAKVRENIIKHEGWKQFPYRCTADKLSIGVGHNIEDRGLSNAAIEFILNEDIETCLMELQGSLSFWDTLPSEVQAALIDLCFNMGISRLMQFRMTIQHLKDGEWDKAAEELLDSRYAAQLPHRAEANADLIRSAPNLNGIV